jgi:hypothetical protein
MNKRFQAASETSLPLYKRGCGNTSDSGTSSRFHRPDRKRRNKPQHHRLHIFCNIIMHPCRVSFDAGGKHSAPSVHLALSPYGDGVRSSAHPTTWRNSVGWRARRSRLLRMVCPSVHPWALSFFAISFSSPEATPMETPVLLDEWNRRGFSWLAHRIGHGGIRGRIRISIRHAANCGSCNHSATPSISPCGDGFRSSTHATTWRNSAGWVERRETHGASERRGVERISAPRQGSDPARRRQPPHCLRRRTQGASLMGNLSPRMAFGYQ